MGGSGHTYRPRCVPAVVFQLRICSRPMLFCLCLLCPQMHTSETKAQGECDSGGLMGGIGPSAPVLRLLQWPRWGEIKDR